MQAPRLHYWVDEDGQWWGQVADEPARRCPGKQAAMDYVANPQQGDK